MAMRLLNGGRLVEAQDDHYQFLGLDHSAPPEAVRAAVDRLVRQADTLAYTSPQDSRRLWERIRRIKHELLTDSDRREAYDRALLEVNRRMLPPVEETPGETDPPEGAEEVRACVADPVQTSEQVAPSAPDTDPGGEISIPAAPPERRGTMRSLWPALAAVLALLVVALIAALAARAWTSTKRPAPTLPELSSSGNRRGASYISGHHIALRLTWVPEATAYRLRVVTSPQTGADAARVRRPLLMIFMHGTSYLPPVAGARLYLWGVHRNSDPLPAGTITESPLLGIRGGITILGKGLALWCIHGGTFPPEAAGT